MLPYDRALYALDRLLAAKKDGDAEARAAAHAALVTISSAAQRGDEIASLAAIVTSAPKADRP